MAKESDFQKEVAGWLRKQGCRVIKQDPAIGKQKGIPDLLVLYKKAWMMLEIKASKTSKFRPGQKKMIDTFGEWSYTRVVFPENFDIIKNEISKILDEEDERM